MKYTPEMTTYLIEKAGMPLEVMSDLLNKKFNVNNGQKNIRSKIYHKGIVLKKYTPVEYIQLGKK